MSGVDEEAYLFVGDGTLAAQHDEAQDAGEQGGRQEQVERVGCRSLPEGAVDHNLQTAFFQYPLFLLVGDGADAQRVLPGIQVGEADGVLSAGAAPFGVVTLQLPGVENERRIVIVDGRHVQRKQVLVVSQMQNLCVVNVLFQR